MAHFFIDEGASAATMPPTAAATARTGGVRSLGLWGGRVGRERIGCDEPGKARLRRYPRDLPMRVEPCGDGHPAIHPHDSVRSRRWSGSGSFRGPHRSARRNRAQGRHEVRIRFTPGPQAMIPTKGFDGHPRPPAWCAVYRPCVVTEGVEHPLGLADLLPTP